MNTVRVRRCVFCFLTLLIMAAIFFFSSQNGSESGNTSHGLIKHLAEIFVRSFRSLSPEEKYEYAEKLQSAVRTLAHFSAFAMLGLSVSATARSFGLTGIKAFSAEAAFCVLYAVSDEIHQCFVPGRSAELIDVAVDTAGSITGIAMLLLICRIYNAAKRRKKNDPPADAL